MVTNVTSLSRSGLWDWLIQRITGVVLAVYVLCVCGFLLANPDLTRADLLRFFGQGAMQVFSTLALLSVGAHAWIGMWTIGTDYIGPHYVGSRATTYRFMYQTACIIVLFVYVVWGLEIFWSL
ncbi:MAG: succinate dehydrogenase, hydrophobic membrane anchor protein [Pseudomonadales bacterium]